MMINYITEQCTSDTHFIVRQCSAIFFRIEFITLPLLYAIHCKNVSFQLPSYSKATGNGRRNNPADHTPSTLYIDAAENSVWLVSRSIHIVYSAPIDIVHVPRRIVFSCILSLPSHPLARHSQLTWFTTMYIRFLPGKVVCIYSRDPYIICSPHDEAK